MTIHLKKSIFCFWIQCNFLQLRVVHFILEQACEFLNTCSDSWEYETTSESYWYIVTDGTPEGNDPGISVDMEINVRSPIPLIEVTDTTRMIDEGDYWKVDLGFTPAGSVFNIAVLFDAPAITSDDIDIMWRLPKPMISFQVASATYWAMPVVWTHQALS